MHSSVLVIFFYILQVLHMQAFHLIWQFWTFLLLWLNCAGCPKFLKLQLWTGCPNSIFDLPLSWQSLVCFLSWHFELAVCFSALSWLSVLFFELPLWAGCLFCILNCPLSWLSIIVHLRHARLAFRARIATVCWICLQHCNSLFKTFKRLAFGIIH